MSVSSPTSIRVSTSPPGEASTDESPAAALACVTREFQPGPPALVDLLPRATDALAFTAGRDGLVGWGRYAAITVTGDDAAAHIERWYRDRLAELAVVDDVGVPGSGPVCFVSLGFSETDSSVAVIPEVVVGRRDGRGFMTRIGNAAHLPDTVDPTPPSAVMAPGEVRYSDAQMPTIEFMTAVQTAMTRIRAHEASKVVLAHGLTATTQFDVDERFLLTRLAERYPICTTFAVDGLVGASPETLISRRGHRVRSRVLAGTAWRDAGALGASGRSGDRSDPDLPPAATADRDAAGGDGGAAEGDGGNRRRREGDSMHRIAQHLLTSAKDLAEHAFAVRSVVDVLAPLARRLDVPDHPSALELANLTHLATDIVGDLPESDGPGVPVPSALELAAALHPSAAVGGTPTAVARAIISELEPAPRGRYAAPVGWLDARGDGEFAIALRCAEIDGRSVRMMAGCGIVADSDPATEAREAQVKMVPIRDALEG